MTLRRKTELKRGSKPLKRTGFKNRGKRMKRKRDTERKHAEAAVVSKYRQEHQADELRDGLKGAEWKKFKVGCTFDDIDPHHIHHPGGVQYDMESNLIAIPRSKHKFIHEKESVGSQIACMLAKLKTKMTLRQRRKVLKDWSSIYSDPPFKIVNMLEWIEARRSEVPAEYVADVDTILGMFR